MVSLELTWIVGVLLLLCTLGMFFTGQVLRWDPDAYWGLAVGGAMAGRVPAIEPQVVHGVLGGPIIGGPAAQSLLHPACFYHSRGIVVFLAVHLWLVLKCGISAGSGRCRRSSSYEANYEKQLKQGVPFLGEAMLKDVFFSALVVVIVVAIAAIVGPRVRRGRPIRR